MRSKVLRHNYTIKGSVGVFENEREREDERLRVRMSERLRI
jgi:hypothetical protein